MDTKTVAATLFNKTWDLLDQTNRTTDEDALMIHTAHASLYHWMQVGTSVNIQRGEWMISHVYAVLKRFEPALYHATRCMELTTKHEIDDFDRTFAYEALARAYAITDKIEAKRYCDMGIQSLKQIKNKEDLVYASSQLHSIEI